MKHIYSLLLTGCMAQASLAQNSIRPNIYMQDMQYYNPASVALDSNYQSQTALYGKYKSVENDAAIWDKPMNIWLSHAGRIGQRNSIYTVSYINDRYSFFSRNALYVGFVRQTNISASSSLSYGARAVANMDNVNWDKLQLPHTETGKSRKFNPDLDLGLTYQFKRFSAGVGLKNLLGASTKMDDAVLLKSRREVNVNFSYRQPIVTQFSVTPFVLLMNERSTIIDAGLGFSFFNRLYASYALRVNELKSVMVLDANITKSWSVGVAYDRSSLVSDNNWDFVVRYRR